MIEDYIENHAVFTRRELMENCGDTQNNANLLSRAKRSGKVVLVARGVYASNTGRFRADVADPYEVAQKLGKHVVFAYGSALALLIGTHDATSRVVFYTHSPERRTEWNGNEYIGYPMPREIATSKRRLPNGVSVRFTDKVQSILDCLARPDRCGGAETLLRSLSTIEFVDADRLTVGALKRSKSVVSKLGWLLDTKSDEWGVPDETIEKLGQEINGKGPFYFMRSHNTVPRSWCAKWRLYLPAPADECERWLEG